MIIEILFGLVGVFTLFLFLLILANLIGDSNIEKDSGIAIGAVALSLAAFLIIAIILGHISPLALIVYWVVIGIILIVTEFK